MKQHLLGEQLKEVGFEERMTLLSIVTGLTKEYMKEEYEQGIKKSEEGTLRAYGYNVNIGEMIEIIENYTTKFPIPKIEKGQYTIDMAWEDTKGHAVTCSTSPHSTYCDALYEVVKKLLNEKYIEV